MSLIDNLKKEIIKCENNIELSKVEYIHCKVNEKKAKEEYQKCKRKTYRAYKQWVEDRKNLKRVKNKKSRLPAVKRKWGRENIGKVITKLYERS